MSIANYFNKFPYFLLTLIYFTLLYSTKVDGNNWSTSQRIVLGNLQVLKNSHTVLIDVTLRIHSLWSVLAVLPTSGNIASFTTSRSTSKSVAYRFFESRRWFHFRPITRVYNEPLNVMKDEEGQLVKATFELPLLKVVLCRKKMMLWSTITEPFGKFLLSW